MTRHLKALGRDQRNSGWSVAAAFLLMMALFWPSVLSFPRMWLQFDGTYGMSHAWLVTGLVAWLPRRDRDSLLAAENGYGFAFLPLAGLTFLWLAVTIAQIQVFHQVTFLLLLGCWGLAVFGRHALRTVVAASLTFLLALPIWDALVPTLGRVTTLVSGGLVRLLGITAEIRGDLVSIPAGTFLIGSSCSGVRFLLAGLVIGAFYAHLLVRRWPVQLAVIGIAAITSVVGNWIRVTCLILIGHVTSMESSLMEDHGLFGWLVFAAGLVPFFLLAPRIEEWDAARIRGDDTRSKSRKRRNGSGRELDIEEKGSAPMATPNSLEPEGYSVRRLERPVFGNVPPRAAAAVAVAAVGPILYFAIGAMPAVDLHEKSLEAVALGEGWHVDRSSGERPFDWRPAYQGEQEHESLAFTDGERFVYGDRFVYREQRQGAKLIGYPNGIAPASDIFEERVIGPVEPSGRLWVRQAVVLTQEGPVLVWYWYRVGGVDTFSPVHAKVLEVPAFLSRRRAAELMALSAVCEPDNCRDAFQALAELMGARFPESAGVADTSEAAGGPPT
jgi:exosortase